MVRKTSTVKSCQLDHAPYQKVRVITYRKWQFQLVDRTVRVYLQLFPVSKA